MLSCQGNCHGSMEQGRPCRQLPEGTRLLVSPARVARNSDRPLHARHQHHPRHRQAPAL